MTLWTRNLREMMAILPLERLWGLNLRYHPRQQSIHPTQLIDTVQTALSSQVLTCMPWCSGEYCYFAPESYEKCPDPPGGKKNQQTNKIGFVLTNFLFFAPNFETKFNTLPDPLLIPQIDAACGLLGLHPYFWLHQCMNVWNEWSFAIKLSIFYFCLCILSYMKGHHTVRCSSSVPSRRYVSSPLGIETVALP